MYLIPRFLKTPQPRDKATLELDLNCCEALEDRQMMAGDVAAAITADGTLKLNGDNQSNQISFGKLGNGEMVVVGLNGTKINGQTTFFTGMNSVEGDLRVNLKGGNNVIRVNELAIGGDLNIRSKGGADTIGIIDSHVGGKTKVRTGNGEDFLAIGKHSAFDGKLDIRTQGGHDYVFIRANSQITADIDVNMAGGNDLALFIGEFGGELKAKMGAGTDNIGTANLQAGIPVTFDMGGGNDVVIMAMNTSPVSVNVNGQGGDDGFRSQVGNPIVPRLESVEVVDVNATDVNATIVTGANLYNSIYLNRGGQAGDIV